MVRKDVDDATVAAVASSTAILSCRSLSVFKGKQGLSKHLDLSSAFNDSSLSSKVTETLSWALKSMKRSVSEKLMPWGVLERTTFIMVEIKYLMVIWFRV